MSWQQPPLFDKKGVPIHEHDVLKIYHYTGARRKRIYMYKWVIRKDGYLYGHHLGRGDADSYLLLPDYQSECEVVQGFGGVAPGQDFTDRKKGPKV